MTLLEAPWGNRDAEMNICWPYPEIVDGYALPLEGPGLGIQFDEELAASKPFVPSLQPRLNGLDESVRDFQAFAPKAPNLALLSRCEYNLPIATQSLVSTQEDQVKEKVR